MPRAESGLGFSFMQSEPPRVEQSGLRLMRAAKDFVVRSLLGFTGSQKFLTTQLDVTNACNLTCAHCYHAHHNNSGALDLAGWRAILDQYGRLADKLYLEPRFVICGGEPTISQLFWPLLDELRERWPAAHATILTNATRLDRSFAARLKGYNVGFQISLDGPDQARHDLIRGAGNFGQAMRGLANLQEVGLNASFLATLSLRTSLWIDDFFVTAANARVERMSFTRFIPQGNGRRLEINHEDRPLSPPELRRAYLTILAASRQSGVETNTNSPLFQLISPELGASGKTGFQGLVIDYKGNLKVTSRTDYRLGNILEQGLETLFLGHPLMRALRKGEIEGCGGCVHYASCGGDRNASFAATGSFLKKDPGCWLENEAGELTREVA